jgi:hypothetical protein
LLLEFGAAKLHPIAAPHCPQKASHPIFRTTLIYTAQKAVANRRTSVLMDLLLEFGVAKLHIASIETRNAAP